MLTEVWARLEAKDGGKDEREGAIACFSAGGMGTQARHEYKESTSPCLPGGHGWWRGSRGGIGVLVGGL